MRPLAFRTRARKALPPQQVPACVRWCLSLSGRATVGAPRDCPQSLAAGSIGRMGQRHIALFTILVASGCATAFTRLPAAERARFDTCRVHIRPTICQDESSRIVCSARTGAAANEFGALATVAERSRWLVGHGCPPGIVDYGAEEVLRAASSPPSPASNEAFQEFRQRQATERASQERRRDLLRPRAWIARDEFTREGEVRYQSAVVWERAGLPDGWLRLAVNPDSMGGSMLVTARSSPLRWSSCARVDLLIDGQPASVGAAEHRIEQAGTETVSAALSPETLGRLTRSEAVRARLCNDIFSLDPDALRALHEVGTLLEQLRAEGASAGTNAE